MCCKRNQKRCDANQESYRKEFGIEDQFLIKYVSDEYIIFIDNQNDIDWVDKRDTSKWDTNRKTQHADFLSKLTSAESLPLPAIDKQVLLTFKRKLGAAYILLFDGHFNSISEEIDSAIKYIQTRNTEHMRKVFLQVSGIISLVAVLALLGTYISGCWSYSWSNWVIASSFGIIGSFVSIWTRNSELCCSGESGRSVHIMEAVCRCAIGGVFAFVAMILVKCGLLFSALESIYPLYTFMLVGFIGGFSERFVPSIIDKVTTEE